MIDPSAVPPSHAASTAAEPSRATAVVFPGGSEMAQRCRAFDWTATPLGPVAGWAPSLRTAAGLVLGAGFPMLLLWGPDLVQLYNDGYVPFLAARHPVGLGRPTREVWPEAWHRDQPIYARVFAGEAVAVDAARIAVRRQDTDGPDEQLDVALAYSPVPDDVGGVGGVLVTLRDVTAEIEGRAAEAERVRLAAALAAERITLLEEVFGPAPSFVHVLRGPDLVFELANAAYYQLVGQRDLVGRPAFEAMPEAAAGGYPEIIARVMASREPFSARERPITLARTPGAPPEERLIDLVYLPLVDADGSCTRVLGHGTDVTDLVRARRRTEGALAWERESLAATLEAAHTVMAVYSGPEHVITRVSPTWERMVGKPDAVGRTAREVFPEMIPTGIWDQLDQVYETGEPLTVTERALPLQRHPDGPVEEAVWSFAWMPLPGAYPEGPSGLGGDILLHAVDVTARVRADAFQQEMAGHLAAQNAQLSRHVEERERLLRAESAARAAAEAATISAEAASRAKSEFLAVMSHELRTPLNAIGGYAELIELGLRGPVTDLQRQDLARLQRSQRHLLGLINGVLNYTKVEGGHVYYEVADVPVDEVVASAEALIAPQARAKHLTLRCDVCSADVRARADGEKLQQVLLNLLSNAVKFTAPGGVVTLSCEAVDAMVIVRVTDTGYGIPESARERIFHPFVQVDARLTRTQEGTGLGLAISRDLARGMGGDLTVESEVGRGSTFTLSLPRADA